MRQLLHGLALGLIAAGVGLWLTNQKRTEPPVLLLLSEADENFLAQQNDRLH